MEVLEVGSDVVIGGNIPAIVIGICISPGPQITYQCCWWNGLDRKSEWIHACEINGKKWQQIGFKTAGK